MSDEHFRFCRVSYWRENEDKHPVSTTKEKGWTKCVVSPLSSQYSYGEQHFAHGPHADHEVSSLIALLQQAYERGKQDKLREIKQLLEIPLR